MSCVSALLNTAMHMDIDVEVGRKARISLARFERLAGWHVILIGRSGGKAHVGAEPMRADSMRVVQHLNW